VSGPEFFETRMGQQFYDGTMKRVADALVDIAGSLKVIGAYTTMKVEQAREAPPIFTPERVAPYTSLLAGLVGELVELLHDHDTAWDGEEDSVKEEHAELMMRTKEMFRRLRNLGAVEPGR